jgi:hypothetical protein
MGVGGDDPFHSRAFPSRPELLQNFGFLDPESLHDAGAPSLRIDL